MNNINYDDVRKYLSNHSVKEVLENEKKQFVSKKNDYELRISEEYQFFQMNQSYKGELLEQEFFGVGYNGPVVIVVSDKFEQLKDKYSQYAIEEYAGKYPFLHALGKEIISKPINDNFFLESFGMGKRGLRVSVSDLMYAFNSQSRTQPKYLTAQQD